MRTIQFPSHYAVVLAVMIYLPLVGAARTTSSSSSAVPYSSAALALVPLASAAAGAEYKGPSAAPTRIPLVHKKYTSDNEMQFLDAVYNSNVAEVERFLQLGVSPYVCCNYWSAFACAILKGHCAIIKLLLDHGAHPNDACYYKHLFEGHAYYQESLEDSSYFLLTCRNLHHNDYFPSLPLQTKLDVINLLIQYGADVNITDEFGCSPLMFMAQDHPALVAKLLAHTANPSLTDKSGKTALSFCTQRGTFFAGYKLSAFFLEYDIVKLLVEAGCDHTLPDGDGKRAIDYSTNSKVRCLLTRFDQYPTIQQFLKNKLPKSLAAEIIISYMSNDYEDKKETDFPNLIPPKQKNVCCPIM